MMVVSEMVSLAFRARAAEPRGIRCTEGEGGVYERKE